MDNITTPNEELFAGQLNAAYTWYINTDSTTGIQHYAINSLLYLRTIKEKHIQMYKEFIMHLHMYAKAIRIPATGYLPISLVIPLKFKDILNVVKTMIRKTNQDYVIVIKRLHLYYDIK